MPDVGLSPQEQDVRHNRLTGSTYAAYLGYSPYLSPLAQWEVNEGLRSVETTDEMDAGNDLEPGIRNMVMRKYDIKLHKPSSVFHVKHPEAIVVHFDALCDAERFGVQIKNHHPWVAKLATADDPAREYRYRGLPDAAKYGDNNVVPLHYNMQCQIEMEVARWAYGEGWGDWWMLASFFGGANLRCHWIKRDGPLIDAMLSIGLQFWRQHLDPHGPHTPPYDVPHMAIKPDKPKPRPKALSAEELLSAPMPTYT